MKTNPCYMFRKVLDEAMLIPTGEATQDFNGILTLNETAEFIWTHIDESESPEDLANKLADAFEVEKETAYQDVCSMLYELELKGMIDVK